MPRKKQSDIRPENVGKLFLKVGEDIPYRLISCDSEPRALLAKVTDVTVPNVPGPPLSEYKDFVLLKPVHPIEPARKPRADKGQKHKGPFAQAADKIKFLPIGDAIQPDKDLTKRVLGGTPLGG